MNEGILLYDEHKLAVVPIRKVASTTIRECMKEVLPSPAYRLADVYDVPPSYRVLTFTRNPYARLVSFWRHQVRDAEHVHPTFSQYGIMPQMSFAETVLKISLVDDSRADAHIRSQYCQIPCSIHRRGVYSLELWDEHWPRFRRDVHDITGKWVQKTPKQWNKSRGGDWINEYTLEVFDMATVRYNIDLLALKVSTDFYDWRQG